MSSQAFRRTIPVLAALLVTLVTSGAHADTVKYTGGPYQAGSGGEFTFQRITGLSQIRMDGEVGSDTWQTFCMEVNEHISKNATYGAQVNEGDGPSSFAIAGGPNLNGDELDGETAFLYTLFFERDDLLGYAFDGTDAERKADAAALQRVFWKLEGEIDDTFAEDSREDDLWDLAHGKTGQDWIEEHGIGNVRILNLGSAADDWKYQDQLVMVVPVPLPPAAIMGVALLAGMGIVRLRRRRA